jgi:hypothetical protein
MATKIELYLGGSWTDITTYVRLNPGLDITFGVQNEGSTADAATCNLIVNNTDGRFTPRNTAGAYYGNLKRNTPLRVTEGTTVRFVGEVAEFPTRWDAAGKDVWSPLTAAGILRRLQHAASLDSTLVTSVRSLSNITGYWPIEESVGATYIAPGITGGQYAYFTGTPVFESYDLGAGSHAVPTWGAATGVFTPTAASSTGFTAGCWVHLPTSGLTGGEELFRCDVAGTARSWRVIYSPGSGGGVFFQVISSTGVELLASSTVTGLDGTTFFVKMECVNSGSNVSYAVGTLDVGGTLSGSIVGASVGAPVQASIGAGTIAIPAAAEVAIGHVITASTNTALVSTTFDSGRSGYAGETVDARMARLATLYGITIGVTSGTRAPTEMGAQPDGTLLDVLRAAEKADAGGILRDTINAVGLTYITRNARYNDQQTQLVLNYASGHVSPPFEPVDDDQQIRNDVKVNRDNGSSARATKTSGALSTAAYPSGVGPYPFEDSYDTYLDTQLPYLAQWVLALGTIDETRFPAVTVDLLANPSLVTDAEAIRPGHRLRITNLPAYAGTTNVDLQVLGWKEHISKSERTITFVCAPGSVWLNAFELDDTTFGKLDENYLVF